MTIESQQAQSLNNQPQTRNVALTVMLILGSLLSFITAVLMISGRYIQLGYLATPDGNAYAGMEIWGLNEVAAVLTVIVFITAIISAVWPKVFAKNISWLQLSLSLLSLVFLGLTFFPWPFEFQVRQYHSASQHSYILLAQDSADFIEGNENIFTGSLRKEEIENFYPEHGADTREFNCVTETSWWWGKLAVIHNFYPILDKQNHLALLQKHCQEITHGPI